MKRQKKPPADEPAKPSAGGRDWLLGFLLVAATIIAYQPAWHAGMIWDDDRHITPPELRSFHGLARIWTELGATQQYYPLVHSVFWLEHRLWGGATEGYHWVNILLHAFSALLFVKILRQLKIPGAWLAGALFALHPVEVESVAWISELKNTLSGVFYLGAALVYLGFDRNRSGRNYALALGLFLLGLMSKTVIASLPAALLVIFWWQRGKLSWKRDALPLMPFFLTGIGAGLFTAWVERKFIGAEGAEFSLTAVERFLVAGRAVWFYLGKLVWPMDLAFIYPRWNVSPAVWWQYLFPAAVLLLLGVLMWRRWRGPLAALLFFAGTLFPALGFLNVYPLRYSFVADHFQYLASLGPLTLAAVILIRRPVVAVALLLALGALTWRQCGMYANIETLWVQTIRLNPDCWMAHNNLGKVLRQNGEEDEAIAHFQKALAIKPDYSEAHYNLGNALVHKGRLDEAIACYQKSLASNPDNAEADNNLGVVFFRQGRMDEAIAAYQKALAITPGNEDAQNNLGRALLQKGNYDEAITHLQKALQINPDYAKAHNNLGKAFLQKGNYNDAIAHLQKALQIQPDYAEAHLNLGLAFFQSDRMVEAITHYQKALEIRPDYLEAENQLAWLLAASPHASVRNGDKAVELARQANALSGGRDPVILHTLGAAYAEAGRFPEALETAQLALGLAGAQSNTRLVGALQAEIKLYQAGSAFHIPAQAH